MHILGLSPCPANCYNILLKKLSLSELHTDTLIIVGAFYATMEEYLRTHDFWRPSFVRYSQSCLMKTWGEHLLSKREISSMPTCVQCLLISWVVYECFLLWEEAKVGHSIMGTNKSLEKDVTRTKEHYVETWASSTSQKKNQALF